MSRFTLFLAAMAVAVALCAAASNPEDQLLETIGVEHEGVREGLKQVREGAESAYSYLKGLYNDAVETPAAVGSAPPVADDVKAKVEDIKEDIKEDVEEVFEEEL